MWRTTLKQQPTAAFALLLGIGVGLLLVVRAAPVWSQHSDIGVYRDLSGRITTHDEGAAGRPVTRAFTRAFEFFGHPFGNPSLPKVFVGDDPGFLFSGLNAPPEFESLPINTLLSMNLLPFRLPEGHAGNLFHWDGVSGSVQFGALPPHHSLTVTEDGGAHSFELDGTNARHDGVVVGITDAEGGMHNHLQFRLDDNDDNVDTDPATGFYLFGFELTMTGLENSEPVFVAISSPEIPSSVEEQVLVWMGANLDNLKVGAVSGDFDGNGAYECNDINQLVAEIAAGTHGRTLDLTGDGLVNLDDRDAWLAEAGAANLFSGNAYLLGDANLDGDVDVSDFNLWNGSKFTSVPAWCDGDFNADGAVDVSDFNLWNGNKFTSADGHPVFVPEPGGVLLVLLATAFFGRHVRGVLMS